jgi:predicted nucleotidyltransferase
VDLVERLREAARRELEGSPVLVAYLFGSVATGRSRPGSDVDVAVVLEPSVPPERFLELSLELARALATASGMGGIEVVVLNGAPLPLAGRALSERVVLFSRDEPFRVRFEGKVLKEYLDFQIHAAPLDRDLLRATAEGRR